MMTSQPFPDWQQTNVGLNMGSQKHKAHWLGQHLIPRPGESGQMQRDRIQPSLYVLRYLVQWFCSLISVLVCTMVLQGARAQNPPQRLVL